MGRKSTKINGFLDEGKAFTVKDASLRGISHQLLAYYCQKGVIIRESCGVYAPAGSFSSEYPEIEILQKRGTRFVLCMLSALRFHGFTTQNPAEVWIAVRKGCRVPRADFQMVCSHFSDECYEFGIEEHVLNGLAIEVYSPAKTVADCFRFRNRYGLDTAIEALWDGWRRRKFSIDELNEAARVCRVKSIMEPYIEMMINEQ